MASHNDLRIASYNCNSVRTPHSMITVRALCDRNDIVCLQEHMLPHQDLAYLQNIHPDFYGYGTSPVDLRDGPMLGRPRGGLAVLWRKTIAQNFTLHSDICKDRILVFEITTKNESCIFLNVYMPYQCNDNLDMYLDCLGDISAVHDEYNTSNFCIIGDLNADIDNGIFGPELHNFCLDLNFRISDMCFLPPDTYTYISNAWNTTSWLDHAITSQMMHQCIKSMQIAYDLCVSDHFPLELTLGVQLSSADCNNRSTTSERAPQPVWSKATRENIAHYGDLSHVLARGVNIPTTAVMCRNPHCTAHKTEIDQFYEDIVNTLKRSTDQCVPRAGVNMHEHERRVPGWNDHVKDKYNASREVYLQWMWAGRPRDGPLAELRRRANGQFKLAYRRCKKEEIMLRNDKMARDYANKNCKNLWKTVKKVTNSRIPLPNKVGNATNCKDIVKLFQEEHEKLMNCVGRGSRSNENMRNLFDKITLTTDMKVSPPEVELGCKRLKTGKSKGPDGLYPESYIYAGYGMHILLSMLFSAVMMHGYMPNMMMHSIISPIVKDKNKDLTDFNNYRGIALATASSKIFEFVLLNRYENLLNTNANQFGFKKRSGTEECVFALKEIINYYFDYSANVYACFVDFSKAFDRVDHVILFKKLIKRDIPLFVVRALSYWYSFQTFAMVWGDSISNSYTVSNGVRQGGILSPFFYNCYTDDLSSILNNSDIGCHIYELCINHLLYADDMCLLSCSIIGLQMILDIVSDYCKKHEIIINVSKTKCMNFANTVAKENYGKVKIDGLNIDVVETFRYLGHFVHHQMDDTTDIKAQLRQFYGRGNAVVRKFSGCSENVKKMLFNSFCGAVYCCSLWTVYNDFTMNRFKVAYNNVFRKLYGLPYDCSASEMFVNSRVKTFLHMRRNAVSSLVSRIQESRNTIVRSCAALELMREHKSPFWHVRDHLLYPDITCSCHSCE